jgi:putative DNA methylase
MKKKLIEVALPLEAINREAAREKSIRHGHPSTLHLWWARRPLAACRAVLFASLVDDPSSLPEEFPTEEAQEKERQRLFRIIEELVMWKNSNNEEVLGRARAEIMKSTGGNPPPVLDPFCGGGSIPLEAQRLGLEAHGSDLNPVAVLITKALIEIPPKFANRPPVNPEAKKKLTHSAKWHGSQGLAEDVRYYGKWMRDEAEKRIGHLYPRAKLDNGREATVIAWLWARTVKCSNPACGIEAPLIRSFSLSAKPGREASLQLTARGESLHYEVVQGPPSREGTVGRRGAECASCAVTMPLDYIRSEGKERRIGDRMIAVVAEGDTGRAFLNPTPEQEAMAGSAIPPGYPTTSLPGEALGFRVQGYGIEQHRELFTPRQLQAVNTFADLLDEARNRIVADIGGHSDDADAYSDAILTYLAFAIDKVAEGSTTLCTWSPLPTKLHVVSTFGRQVLPMVWDYAEANVFANSSGNFERMTSLVAEVLALQPNALQPGNVEQRDATSLTPDRGYLISTDPPYYDNIAYAELSDFFYVWLRKGLGTTYPSLFSTLLTPKVQELIASPFRFGGSREAAKEFFEEGLGRAFERVAAISSIDYPVSIYYSFKQSEDDENGATASTGWETMLSGLIGAGFLINGTWPVRAERAGGFRNKDRNSLASSIVLICRARSERASIATRRQFIAALKAELPDALKKLQHSNIAAVDLAQVAIGPGMAVFSRYAKVIEADGSPMRVRSALQLINQALDEVLTEQESEYDADTQWAVAWFDQYGTSEAPFGDAETLSKAKNTSVGGLVESGLLRAAKGKVQLIARDQLDTVWDPTFDRRLTIWEVTQHLIARLKSGGEQAAADLLRKVGGMGEFARDLAYRLYSVCERKGWTEEAIAYNSLVVAWPEITRLAAETPTPGADEQTTFG